MTAPIVLPVRTLSREGFAPFGEVIDIEGAETRLINQGTTTRFHALATARVDAEGARVISKPLGVIAGRCGDDAFLTIRI